MKDKIAYQVTLREACRNCSTTTWYDLPDKYKCTHCGALWGKLNCTKQGYDVAQPDPTIHRVAVLSVEEFERMHQQCDANYSEFYCIQGNRAQAVRTLEEAQDFFDVKKLAFCALSPNTIGELKRGISCMDDSITVFAFAYGNKEGHSSWKRKQTWKQWLKTKV